MLSAPEAEALILSLVHPLDPQQDTETLELLSASQRILAQPVTSHLDFPHWDNSAMDGYAVRFTDVQTCSVNDPVVLEVIEEIPAGYVPKLKVQPGQASRIFTGSMLPAGADTVVMQEVTQRQDDCISILSSPRQAGAFVRRQGDYYRAGDPLLAAGIQLSAPEIAVLAAAQCSPVRVYRRLRVAILSTGSELVSPEQPLQPGQIVDSNQYALATLIAEMGAEPLSLGIVPDQKDALQVAIAHAITIADVVLSSGGVSVGDYDYVEPILEALNGTIHIQSVAVKPGKPLTVATFEQSAIAPRPILYFGLPGNPASALVSFWRFVVPALRKLSGLKDGWMMPVVKGRSFQELRADGKRETYLWGKLLVTNGEYGFQLAGGSRSSGNLINLTQTNCLAILPVGTTLVAEGEVLQIMPLIA